MPRYQELLCIVALLGVSVPVLSAPFGDISDARLRAAMARGSLVELGEIGTNLSHEALFRALSATHREVVLGAIAAVERAPDNWRYLALLADRAGGPDRPLAALAAEVAADIVGQLDPQTIAEQEIASAELDPQREAWLSVAHLSGHYADVRVRALEVLAGLARLPVYDLLVDDPERAGYELAALAADDEPEIRRAALELWPSARAPDDRAVAVHALRDDPDQDVALAAALLLCPPVGADGDDRADTLAAMGEAGRTRLMALLGEFERAPAALLAGARCLAADPSEASQDALRTLAEQGPEAIRAAVRSLLAAGPERARP